MPGSNGSAEADEGGTASDDDSGMSGRGSLSDPRWSRMTGGTKGWRLRGVEWRVKLGILPGGNASVDAMRRASADGRRKYADLRRRLLVDPHIMDDDQTASQLGMDNPLSLDPESVWGRYFRNAELEKTIDKDLTRLYPEHGVFFQSAPCQAMMRRILLVWSLIHPQFSYRQGMHELLAPLLYVLHVDVVRLSQVKHRFEDLFDDRFDSLSLQEQHVRDKVESAQKFCGEMIVVGDSINFRGRAESAEDGVVDPEEKRVDLSVIIQGSDMYGVEGELGALLSARFLEHDAYCMLDTLLSGQGGAVAMADYFTASCGGGKPPVIEASFALYRTLAAADVSLYTHLVELGVEPQVFALRWLRFLFGREFVLDDLLRVWDAVFEADNTPLYQLGGEDSSGMKVSQRGALISSFSVSMLLYVRPALLAAPDATACLQRLLNFPQVPDVRDLIEGAKSLQLLAQAAVKSPGTPVPRNTRGSDIRSTGKHARSGSISPPTPQRHVIRPQNITTSSPDVLRLSMSLPGSYWEEKWTHSVLQKKSPEDLFSPRASRTEPLARGLDNVDREGSNATGMLSRSNSEGRRQRPEPAAANLSVRNYDSSQDSSDDDGQEMLRRGGESSDQDSVPKDSSCDATGSNVDTDRSPSASHSSKQEVKDNPWLDPGEDVSLAFASAAEQDVSSVSLTLRENSVIGHSGLTTSKAVESIEVENHAVGRMGFVDRDQTMDTISDFGNEMDSRSQDIAQVEGGVETCQTSLESNNAEAAPAIAGLRGSLSETQNVSHAGMEASGNGLGCMTLEFKESSEYSLVPDQICALQSESATVLEPEQGISPASVGIESSKMRQEPQNEEERTGDSLQSVTLLQNSCIESKGDHDGKHGIIGRTEGLLASESKPPLPPSRLGRFNWMWSLGRSSFGEKAATSKVSKEDSLGNDVTLHVTGTVAEPEIPNSVSANTAQRRKKSWWRANSDVVPEECVVTASNEPNNAVDACSDVLGPADSVKLIIESAAVASEVQPKEEEVVAEIPVPGQDAVKNSNDMTPSAACEVVGQDSSRKPKEMTPSAALQALGQAVLEHAQVLESALAQKVAVLGIESIMWTPAVREKSESTNRAALGSKGQLAAVAAIAELRKISQALQQM